MLSSGLVAIASSGEAFNFDSVVFDELAAGPAVSVFQLTTSLNAQCQKKLQGNGERFLKMEHHGVMGCDKKKSVSEVSDRSTVFRVGNYRL